MAETRVGDAMDSVALFLGRSLGPPTSSTVNDEPRERSVVGLKALAEDYAWGGVLELATSLLADDEDAIEAGCRATVEMDADDQQRAKPSSKLLLPHERLVVESYRGLALVQTRMLDRATAVIEALGSLDESNTKYRYESYPESYPEHASGSFVPFELCALAVEIRVRRGDAGAVAECYALRERRPDRAALLTSALVGYHLRAYQHDTAVELARAFAKMQGSTARAMYVYARVLLHVGDFDQAESVISRANARDDSSTELRYAHRALLLGAQGKFTEALAENERVVSLKQSDPDHSTPHVRVYATCNAAICLMQLGRLLDGIKRLEDCLREDPETALDEGLVFNLSTMYDLAYPDEAAEKKRVLHRLASRYGRQGFNLDLDIGL